MIQCRSLDILQSGNAAQRRMKIVGSSQKVWRRRITSRKGFTQRTRRCRAWEKSSNPERLSLGGQLNPPVFYSYYPQLANELKLYIDLVYLRWTLQGGELVLGARIPRKDVGSKVTLPSCLPSLMKKDNTPLWPQHWNGASPSDSWVVASQHQRLVLLEHIL